MHPASLLPIVPPAQRNGLQLMLDLFDCQCDLSLLQQAHLLQPAMLALVDQAQLQRVGACFHQFQPVGATGVVLLAESHFAIHTWPEQRFVSADLYICQNQHNHQQKADDLVNELLNLLQSKKVNIQKCRRASPFADKM